MKKSNERQIIENIIFTKKSKYYCRYCQQTHTYIVKYLCYNEKRKTFRRLKYCFFNASNTQLKQLNALDFVISAKNVNNNYRVSSYLAIKIKL